MNGRARGWWRTERWGAHLVGVLLAIGFLVLLFWRSVFVVIGPGEVGVLFDLLVGGTKLGKGYGEGLSAKFPWNACTSTTDACSPGRPYSVSSLSREGMRVEIDATALFRIDLAKVGALHKQIGPDYVDRLVGPITIGVIREYVTRHGSHELYTIDSRTLPASILAVTRAQLTPNHIVVDDVIVRQLILT